jgi:hypothetical protein
LVGLERDRGGRKPRWLDIKNKPAFLNYLRGIVSSLVYARARKQGFESGKEWNDNIAPHVTGQASPAEEAALRDFAEELFPRLRARAPRRLLATIAGWESVYHESDRIPAQGGRRKYVGQVKSIAQQIVREIGGLT